MIKENWGPGRIALHTLIEFWEFEEGCDWNNKIWIYQEILELKENSFLACNILGIFWFTLSIDRKGDSYNSTTPEGIWNILRSSDGNGK